METFKAPERKPQSPIKERMVFSASEISDVDQTPPAGYTYLYRGVDKLWQPLQLDEQEFSTVYSEKNELIHKVVDGKKWTVADKSRFDELWATLEREGDQWFTDNAEIAEEKAGRDGSILRIAVPSAAVFPFMRETGGIAAKGGVSNGTNFILPREWFVGEKF